MGLFLLVTSCIGLLWALVLVKVSPFFRGMAIAALGAVMLNVAAHDHYPLWLTFIGASFVVAPTVTTFRRLIFGEEP